MRVSVDKNDPGYCPYHQLVKVYLDGILLDNCITADDVTGECLCYTGKVKHEEAETKIKRGKVTIIKYPIERTH